MTLDTHPVTPKLGFTDVPCQQVKPEFLSPDGNFDCVSANPGPTNGKQAVRPNGLIEPHPSRFDPSSDAFEPCMAAHAAACEQGSQGYIDPHTGLFVMTAPFLASRPCCERGCRHCPYVT